MVHHQLPQDGLDEHKGSRPRAPRPYQALLRACPSSPHQVSHFYKEFGAEILFGDFLVHQVNYILKKEKLFDAEILFANLRSYLPMINLVHISYQW